MLAMSKRVFGCFFVGRCVASRMKKMDFVRYSVFATQASLHCLSGGESF